MDTDLKEFADARRPWIEKELGLDKMKRMDIYCPWDVEFYRKQTGTPEVRLIQTGYFEPSSFRTKEIKISTHKYKEDYKEFYDVLTYKQDELGNLLAKEWDRQIAETINKTLYEEEQMDRDELKGQMGDIDNLEDIVVYFRNGNINFDESSNKDMWYVEEINNRYDGIMDSVILRSITRDNHRFETRINNILLVEALEEYNLINDKLFSTRALDAYKLPNSKKTTEDTETMNNRNDGVVSRTMDANVEAAKVAAKVAAGRTLNGVVAKQLVDRKVLPFMVRGYADTSFGAVVIANIADFAVKQFNVKNPKACLATEAMMQAAMVDLLAEVDFEGIINDVLSNVDLGATEKD